MIQGGGLGQERVGLNALVTFFLLKNMANIRNPDIVVELYAVLFARPSEAYFSVLMCK